MKSVFKRILDALHPYGKVIREARRLEAERQARVDAHDNAWREANPHLVAKGIPPPPIPESMLRIGVYGFGGFYKP